MPLGGLELLILLAIILLFFGAKRVPELGRSLGKGARELKKAASEDDDDGETKVIPEKDANGAKAKAVAPQDAPPSERDGNLAQREPQDR